MKQSKEISYYGNPAILTATAKLAKHGDQPAYLSVTGEVWAARDGAPVGRDCLTCGRLDELIAEHFPNLRPLLPFILCAVPGVPMHYQANAAFWYDFLAGRSKFKPQVSDPDPREAFKRTIAYGTIEGDEACPLPRLVNKQPHPTGGDMRQPFSQEELSAWLDARLPKLAEAFRAACEGAGLTF